MNRKLNWSFWHLGWRDPKGKHMVVTTLVVFGYRLTRRPVTVVKFHNCYISMLCKAYYNVIGVAFSCTSAHNTSCYAVGPSHALPHIRHAPLSHVLMHLHTYVMLRCPTFFSTCTHTSCYAVARSHALPHIYVMLRCCVVSSTCTHSSCYAVARSFALAHIRHATLSHVL